MAQASVLKRYPNGKTELHLLAGKGDLEGCRAFLSLSSAAMEAVDAVDRMGLTPIDEATYLGHKEVALYLRKFSRYSDSVKCWEPESLQCAVCFNTFWKPLSLSCGHTFCRACVQRSRYPTNSCPICRTPIILAAYDTNVVLEKIIKLHFPEEWHRAAIEQFQNPTENAIANLKELGDALGVNLTFNEKQTCILRIDGEWSLHITLLVEKKLLFLYSPILDCLPADDDIRLNVFEYVLQCCADAEKLCGGSVGLLLDRSMIVYHQFCSSLYGQDMDLVRTPAHTLRVLCNSFVGAVRYWRALLQQLLASSAECSLPEHVAVAPELSTAVNSPATRKRPLYDQPAPTPNSPSASCHSVVSISSSACSATPILKRHCPERPLPALPRIPSHSTLFSSAQSRSQRATENIAYFVSQVCPELLPCLPSYSLHIPSLPLDISYDENLDRIVLVAPVFRLPPALPRAIRMKVFEILLTGAAFGSLMDGGGVALQHADPDVIVMRSALRMKHVTSEEALHTFALSFKDTVEKWARVVQEEIARQSQRVSLPVFVGRTDTIVSVSRSSSVEPVPQQC